MNSSIIKSEIIFTYNYFVLFSKPGSPSLLDIFYHLWSQIFSGGEMSDLEKSIINIKILKYLSNHISLYAIYTLGGRNVTNENIELQFLKSNILFEGNLFLS